jgi:hypothetical protein
MDTIDNIFTSTMPVGIEYENYHFRRTTYQTIVFELSDIGMHDQNLCQKCVLSLSMDFRKIS